MSHLVGWSRLAAGSIATAILVATIAGSTAMAQVAGSAGATVPPIRVVDLTAEEQAEREARKGCKIKICAAIRNKKAEANDIACSVLKSWRKEQLTKMLEKAKVSWPWGRVKCSADIRLKRDLLLKATSDERHEATLDPHKVVCEVDRENATPAEIKVEFTPRVTFEKGKAVKAVLGWGKIEAPTLLKGAMWTATATDNTFNVLQSTVVEDINDFIGPRCDEVKDEWAGK
jgi:hypothetical protein